MVEGPLYAELMHLAVTGQLGAIIGGPNCRTRSRLRHIPREGFPGPVRSWEDGQQWGLSGASQEERKKCYQDDLMMLRLIMLFLVAEETRKAGGAIGRQDQTGFLIEHPSSPDNMPDVVSWWLTDQWKRLQGTYSLTTYDLDQGELGGLAFKPTTLGTNMVLAFPEQRVRGKARLRRDDGMSPEEIAQQTKSLARWCPVMMSGIAEACMRTVGQAVKKAAVQLENTLGQGTRSIQEGLPDMPGSRGTRQVAPEAETATKGWGVVLGYSRSLLQSRRCGTVGSGIEGTSSEVHTRWHLHMAFRVQGSGERGSGDGGSRGGA